VACALPEGEDMNEWLAVHGASSLARRVVHGAAAGGNLCDCGCVCLSVCRCAAVDFYNEVSLLYGTISDFCTVESCPGMSAGPECVAR
jgi:MOB kinase activator 1